MAANNHMILVNRNECATEKGKKYPFRPLMETGWVYEWGEDRWEYTCPKPADTEPGCGPGTLVSPASFCSGFREASVFKDNLNMNSAKWKRSRHTERLTLVHLNLQTKLRVLFSTIWKMLRRRKTDQSEKIQTMVLSAAVRSQLLPSSCAQAVKDHDRQIYPTRITWPP